MLKTVSNGQSIHQYIPPHLKRMFYNNPAAVHASQQGVDPYGIITNGLVRYIPLWALKDDGFQSIDAYKGTITVTGALWGNDGRTFDGADDIINCGSAAELDAIVGAHTICGWAYATDSGEGGFARIIEILGGLDSFMGGAGVESLVYSCVVGTVGKTATRAFSYGAWHYFVFMYDGSNVIIGVDDAYTTGDATAGPIDDHSAANLLIGNESSTARTWNGMIGELAIYNRALTAGERTNNYDCTKWRYQ